MTDGIIPPNAPAHVNSLNTVKPKLTINSIMFWAGAPIPGGREEEGLKKIATDNGGTFNRYIVRW